MHGQHACTYSKLVRGSLERETRDGSVRHGMEIHCSFVLFKCCVCAFTVCMHYLFKILF